MKDYRIDNYVTDEKGERILVIAKLDNERGNEKIRAWEIDGPYGISDDRIHPIKLTSEWFKRFHFEVLDMGDFWEFNKGDFQVIQLKVPMTTQVLEPVFVLHSKRSKRINLPYVHKLQNLYYEIEGKDLTFKNGITK